MDLLKAFFRYSILFLPLTSLCQSISGKAISIADGDTFTMLVNDQQIRIRLHGIDAPEKAQPFSQVSKDYISELVFGKTITVQKMDTDRYGRTIGMVFVDGINVNEAMIRSGLAWHYKTYDKNPAWAKLEDEAKSAKKGLWSDANPIPPWEWRRR